MTGKEGVRCLFDPTYTRKDLERYQENRLGLGKGRNENLTTDYRPP